MSHLAELRWMLPPLAMCLVLTGIHGYLGIHVVSRKVIFVDLALAQIAALGSTYAHLLGYDPRIPGDGTVVYLFSLGFTFVGAAVFSLTRMRHENVPQEAFIGIVYATASALAILLLARSPDESEHIKEMLVGNILLVTWPTIGTTALLYSAIGAFHYAFRRPFFEVSLDPERALARGRRVRLWDFAFYASFGLVITSSVAVAGVLLVFSFLVVPAVVAFMFREAMGARIAVAWVVGTVCSAAGMLLSYYGDLPTGPSVVASFAVLLVVAALTYVVRASGRRPWAIARVLGGAVLVAALAWLSVMARKPAVEHTHASQFEALAAALASPDDNTRIEAIHHLAGYRDPHVVELLVNALRQPGSDRVIEHIVQILPEFGEAGKSAVPALEDLARSKTDPFLRFEVARGLLRLHSPSGFAVLGTLLRDEPPLLLQQQVVQLVKEMTGGEFGLAKAGSAEERARATARLVEWLEQKGDRLRWRRDRQRFE
jgi:zinc/manganese transport system permease protein